MRSCRRIFLFLIIDLFLSCSIRPGSGGSGDGGSDVVQPLWTEQSYSELPKDTVQCANVVALLIGIGQYNPANGWESLSSGNDLSLLRATLRKRGVKSTNIHQLIDQQATKAGIQKALQTVADTLPKGTQLLILYAGHARQLPDDSGDEADGYDEALVPYDAPPANQHQPEGYLRDDELNRYLSKIRTAIGQSGSLWLLFDACHSQTLNRGRLAQRMRGGVAPMGLPSRSRSRYVNKHPAGSDWYESSSPSDGLAPYVLFSATIDGSPNFETTDAVGQSLGPLTRAVCEVWTNQHPHETYRTLFNRVAAAMARYAPYQQPGLEGNIDASPPGCVSTSSAPATGWLTLGEPLRVAWPNQDVKLTKVISQLPFVQQAGMHPDLHIDRRARGYRLWTVDSSQPLTEGDVSAEECAERIRQYFARNVLLQLQQTNPDFQIRANMQRVAVRTEQGRTIVTDTLPDLTATGLPAFRTVPAERMLLTLTNTGSKPAYVTVVDLQADGTLHVLLPGEGQPATDTQLRPGQSMRQRIRITKPVGAEVYKILLTPEPIDLRAVLQTRGNASGQHPYETLFQRTYITRGLSQMPLAFSERTGSATDVAFWVMN